MTFRRGGRDSSVSSRGSVDRRRRDRSESNESMVEAVVKGDSEEGTAVPPRGLMVKGKVTRITNFGAFVRVPGYMDGLVHVTRIDDSGRRMFTPDDVRKHMREGDEIFAKVYISLPNKYSLDYRFVNQATGEDLDPNDEQRDRLERKEADEDPHGDKMLELPPVNKVFEARIHSITKFGCFVELLKNDGEKTGFKHGLLPRGKTFVRNGASGECMTPTTRIEDSYKVGDRLWIKVVEIQADKGKYNVDMRYVDQKNGEDLDPSHIHSGDKTMGVVARRDERSRPSSRRSSRSRSRSVIRRRREDGGRDRRDRSRERSRERSRSIRRYRDNDRNGDYNRRHDARSDDRDRKRESSKQETGFSFYGNSRRERSPSDIVRRRR